MQRMAFAEILRDKMRDSQREKPNSLDDLREHPVSTPPTWVALLTAGFSPSQASPASTKVGDKHLQKLSCGYHHKRTNKQNSLYDFLSIEQKWAVDFFSSILGTEIDLIGEIQKDSNRVHKFYRKASLKTHPDHGGKVHHFRMLQKAAAILKDLRLPKD